jgi:hypothetical protein
MHIEIHDHKHTRRGQAAIFAFVNLATAAEATKAIQVLSGNQLHGNKIRVGLAHYRAPTAGSDCSSVHALISPIAKLPAPRVAAEAPCVTSAMPPTIQQPLPSPEVTPLATPSAALPVKKQQSIVASDSEPDTPIVPPGLFLSIPAKRQAPHFTDGIAQGPIAPIRSHTPISIASTTTLSSSDDSTGRQLKADLVDHAQQLDLRPEDSVSNINVAGTPVVVKTESEFAVPSTPKSKFSDYRLTLDGHTDLDVGVVGSAVRFFRGLVRPRA